MATSPSDWQIGLGIASQGLRRQHSVRRGSLGASALVAGVTQSFHLSAEHDHSRSYAFVFLGDSYDGPFHRALVDEALKLFVRTQAQHLFAATSCISLPQIEEHDFE